MVVVIVLRLVTIQREFTTFQYVVVILVVYHLLLESIQMTLVRLQHQMVTILMVWIVGYGIQQHLL
jgi:hypothetical protein